MNRQRVILALVISAAVGACGSTATPPPSTVTAAAPSGSAAAPSAAPSVAPSLAPSSSPTVAPTPTPSVAPTPAPTPVPWKTYTSTRYHYKMQYPPDWVVTPGTAAFADQFDNYNYPYIYVTRDVVSTSVSVNQTVTAEVAYMKSHYKAKLVSNQAIKLANNYAGRLLTFNGTEDDIPVVIKEVIVAKGRVGYFLTMFGNKDTALADRTLFRKMYLTWRPTA